ncbi:MAG: NAD(P)(+) transhydrogenase (Re/Si-specific) subunit beta, partial [Opitutales bacterium]
MSVIFAQCLASADVMWINLAYVVSAVLFILGIRLLGSADTARKGNQLSSVGMLIAVVATLLGEGLDYQSIAIGIVIGAVIGVVAAKKVQMTAMPEMVALFNGFGGLASLLV